MRHIKTVATLCERAERLGVAKNRKRRRYDDYGGMWGSTHQRDLIEVYRIEYDEVYGIAKLYHYDTKTCEIHVFDNIVADIYAESLSDVNSVYTFINYWLGWEPIIGFKPVNGGFYLLTDEQEEVFYDEVDQHNFLSLINS